uniref:Uncharacterized protein n=1 Tax=viral metagenome TaxID=1070528 RepID=A0A6H2A1W4_9ZZZZ
MDYIKLAIVLGIITLGIVAMYIGYGEEVFWIAVAALSGLGGYEIHKKQEALRKK